jgi:DNA-binding MarR family transcriptional regulator
MKMNSTEKNSLKHRLKIAALEHRLFNIRYDHQLLILLIVGSLNKPINRSSLLKKISCSEVSFRKYYNELSDLGLVEITQSDSDKRKKLVKLTEIGREKLDIYEKSFALIIAS